MRFGVIGDIHGFWDAADTAYFNAANYDMLLFVGDLARVVGAVPVARRLSALTTPAVAIPGNHDAVTLVQLLAEIRNWHVLKRVAAFGMGRRVQAMARAMAPVDLGGYTITPLTGEMGVLITRPHAMGPDRFYYRGYLKRAFGVADFKASARALCALIDRAPRDLVILAHNGPAGLGATPASPFGCDFKPDNGDFGDPDLRDAIEHARTRGHRVRAVLAGHMHHRSKHTGTWREIVARDGDTLVINAARVPRIEAEGARRHHVALEITADAVAAETIFVDAEGTVVERETLA